MKKTKIILTTILLIASTWLAKSQSCPSCTCSSASACEYVSNGGFSYYSTLPTNVNQIANSCGWSSYTSANTVNIADYYFSTSSVTAVQIPCNGNGYEYSNLDDGYAGLLGQPLNNATPMKRTIIQTALTSSLTSGNYEITFYLSLADEYQYNAKNCFGIELTIGTSGVPSLQYAIDPTASTTSVSTAGWRKFTINHTSIGGEDILRIGFLNIPIGSDMILAGNTPTACLAPLKNSDIAAYYYIENVSIRRVTELTVSASSTTGCNGETFTLTASGANSYTWNPGALTGTSVAITPTTTTIYTVTGTNSTGCVVTPTTITISTYTCCTNGANNINFRNVNLVASGGIAWTSLVAGGTYTGNINIPASGIITKTLTVMGSFSVSTPVTFSLCNITFHEGVAMKQYSLTTIDHSYLWGCDKLWAGIQSRAQLYISNSWIEDAYYAVDAGYNVSTVANHPGMTIDNVMFNKNYRCIGLGTTTMTPSNLKITGCLFSSRAYGTPDYTTSVRYNTTFSNPAGKAGAKIKGSTIYSITANTIRSDVGIIALGITATTTPNYFTIGDVTGTPSLNINRFDYINEGVVNMSSRLYIINNIFSNIINTGLGNTLGAIYHSNVLGNTETRVGGTGGGNYKNLFNKVRDGVGANYGGQLDVKYNDFDDVSRYGVAVTSWSASSASTQTVQVTSNSFSTTSYAFYANDNRTITATVASNTLVQTQPTYTSTGYGVYINEISKPATVTYSVYSNNFSGGLNGIYATNAKYVRLINNIVQVLKPSGATVNAPIWVDNSDYCTIKGNTLSCNPTNSGDWHTMGILNNASINNTIKCNNITGVGACLKFGYNCNPTSVYYNIFNQTSGADPCLFGIWMDSNGESGDIGYYNGTNWTQGENLFGDFNYASGGADSKCQLSSNSASLTPSKIYYNAAHTPTADYTPQVNLNTNNPLSFDYSRSYTPTPSSFPNSAGCGETSRMMVSSENNQGRNVSTSLTTGNGSANTSQIENYNNDSEFKSSKKRIIINTHNANGREIAGNEGAFWVVDSLMTLYTETKNSSMLIAAKNMNTAIHAINAIEQTQKNFNSIYCVYLENDSLVNLNQVQDIKDIALLCPYTDGLAVYQARALIRNWDDSTHYLNACENVAPDLNTNAARFAANSNSNLEVGGLAPVVYPNPTNGVLTINKCPKNSIFELYDIVGRKLFSGNLNENETQLDLSSFNNGNYLFKIINDGKTIRQDKLMINK